MAATPSRVAAILVAAGSGQRLGADVPKAFVTVAGRTLLEHAAARFTASPRIASVVVVAPVAELDRARRLTGLPVVAGGATRQESVARGLAAVPEDARFVLVHDVARPFVPAPVIAAVVDALDGGADAVVPVVPVHDTVRRLDGDGLGPVVDRSRLAAVQTPQGFRRAVLAAAHAGAAPGATDDAMLAEAAGARVISVPGADESFKITTPVDLARAEAVALLSAAAPSVPGSNP
jgi:2-C-methyl-D-erythritol 4-phosphate cytidylyltransferase